MLLKVQKFKLSLESYTKLKGGSGIMMAEKFVANYLGKYYCNEYWQCCFSKYMLLWSLWHSFSRSKSFIICQHLIVYLSHNYYHCVSHNCNQLIIYLEVIQIYFVNLIAMYFAVWWFVVNRLVSKWSKFCRHTLLALPVNLEDIKVSYIHIHSPIMPSLSHYCVHWCSWEALQALADKLSRVLAL